VAAVRNKIRGSRSRHTERQCTTADHDGRAGFGRGENNVTSGFWLIFNGTGRGERATEGERASVELDQVTGTSSCCPRTLTLLLPPTMKFRVRAGDGSEVDYVGVGEGDRSRSRRWSP